MNLSSLGWDDLFARHFASLGLPDLQPARVAAEHRHAYALLGLAGDLSAECTGRLLYRAVARPDLPAIGDWVAVRRRGDEAHADIHAVLPRRTKFSRRAAGDSGGEQIVAANVDTVLLVSGLDQDFSVRRIERYLTLARDSGAQPVVVLNKADLHPAPAEARAAVETVAAGAPIVVLSALARAADPTQAGPAHIAAAPPACPVTAALAPWLLPGRTLALLGSSGVGKSTLINRLLGGGDLATRSLSSATGKGRHTTARRELFVTASGALLIDTPGMRELQLWDVDEAALAASFDEITALAARCRFRDCSHQGEPGCAVQAALADGSLDQARWQSFQKLQREQAYAARQADPRLARAEEARWRRIHRDFRARQRHEETDGG